MRITINWTDHKYHTYDFEEVNHTPMVGDVIDIPGDIRQTVEEIIDVTDKAARHDFGNCEYSFYIVYYHDEIYNNDIYDGIDCVYLEDNGTSFKCLAVKEEG